MSIWEYLTSETTVPPHDIYLILGCAVLYGIYRFLICKFVLAPLSKYCDEKKRFKFIHRGFDCIHYCTSTLLGSLAFISRPYAHCPYYFLDCTPYMGPTGQYFVCSVFEKIYLFFFCSYYVSDICWIYTANDWKLIMFHHFVTLSLLSTCIMVARPVLGLSIMLLHDWVDIFLYLGKVGTYIKSKFADYFFYMFAVAFFYLRLFGVLSILYRLYTQPYVQTHHVLLYRYSCSCLGGLYVCHIIWGKQIVAAVLKIFFKADKPHDTRSDGGEKKPEEKTEKNRKKN